jgi:DNA topoisomerase-3
MGKALIIAEKPSVAADIARALGGFTKDKSGEFYESDQYVLSSAVGHLLELTVAEEHDVKRGKWTFSHLPHIPPRFALKPIEKNESRLKVLQRLIKRKDVDALINACDAGREGELIFRRIVEFTHARQPIRRLWLQSMTPAAIREGFAQLRSDEEMRPLADAAESRAEADWLIGINGTRAMTAFNSKTGGFHLTTVGRVQTPTLAIVVEREAKIRAFKPRDYWEVIGTFDARAGAYTGRWFDETFKKPEAKEADDQLKPERLWDKERAEAIRAKCLGKPGIVTEESKPTTSLAPLLYDLTSLQRDANSRFGFSAKNTLGLAQALYEKHKVLTYPRTDSRALPEDYLGTVKQTLETLRGRGPTAGTAFVTRYESFARTILENDWVRPNKRIFNNAKISDHFAIIPTPQTPKGLSEPEQKLYDLVTRRFLAIFYPAAEFLETTRITRVEGEPFKSAGKVLVKAGWLEVYGKDAADDDTPRLAPVEPNETVQTREIEVKANVTKPPARYTEATLLSAMEGAGKLVDDDELRAAMADKGLGTPATRAAIIEGLIQEQYLHREGRELVATAKAFSLMALLNGLGVAELTRPELTGDWEFKLRQVQRRQLRRDAFMQEIRALAERIVGKAKQYEHDTIPGDFGALNVRCPQCGGEIHETYKKFECQNEQCDFALWKIVAGRQLEPAEVEELIAKRQVGPLQGFRSKMGRPFAAVIKLKHDEAANLFRAEFDFGRDKPDESGAAVEVDFTGKEPLGKCPKCGARVFENGMNYVCEKSTGASKACDFRTGAVILQQAVDKTQLAKLLNEGKTDLLKGFVSKRTGRKFEAFLVLKDGKVGFEFAPRARKGEAKEKKDAPPPPKLDFTGRPALGKCPRCGGAVFEGPEAYLCERSQAETKRCAFKLEKVKNGQPISVEQFQKLLQEGKTDLLDKFVSRAGKPFSAWLTLKGKGKIEFEFPLRD